jgi:hypothetical protein
VTVALPDWADPAVIAARRPEAIERHWEDRALCRLADNPGDVFFPYHPTGGQTVAKRCREAVAKWCACCQVHTDCVAANINEPEGVFGSTPEQRRELRKRLGGTAGVPVRVDPRAGIPRSNTAVRQARRRATS